MAILSSDDYPSVRAAIDTDLDSNQLPNATIALPVYHDAAEQDVLDRDSSAASRTGTEAAHVRRAAIFYCAARLVPAVVRLTALTVNTRDLSYSRPAFNTEQRAEELRQLAAAELDAYLSSTTVTRGTMFARVSGTRGK